MTKGQGRSLPSSVKPHHAGRTLECLWVNIEIWVSFLHHDLIATGSKKSAEMQRFLKKRGSNNAICYKSTVMDFNGRLANYISTGLYIIPL